MENPNTISKVKAYQTLARPRRGQVKIKIFKGLFKSLASMLGGCGRKPAAEDRWRVSELQPPNLKGVWPVETSSGYCSNAQSDRS
ncbi:hypothetical protein M0R45_016953 [Rubus argutus]|uniref:Uncharacterized protein n=1 Tax=Rubus argutus TaxID=59490 RepID=A0AAW1XW09_RUBAR